MSPTDIVSLFETANGALRFFALLVPGFVALAVYDLRVPGERRRLGDMAVALVAYSVFVDGIVALYMALFPLPKSAAVTNVFAASLADVLIPVLLGWFAVDVRNELSRRGLVLPAVPKAWDEFFNRLARSPGDSPLALIVTLNDGRQLAGLWTDEPFASSFPNEEDLLFTVPLQFDPHTGQVGGRLRYSHAVLLKRADIVSIEAVSGEFGTEE